MVLAPHGGAPGGPAAVARGGRRGGRRGSRRGRRPDRHPPAGLRHADHQPAPEAPAPRGGRRARGQHPSAGPPWVP